MKHFLTAVLVCVSLAASAYTNNYKDMEPLKLDVPEMKAELAPVATENFDLHSMALEAPEAKMDFAFFKSRTNPGTKAYKFMDDMTFVGVPLFIAGIIAKSEKNAFKQQTKHSLVTKFKTGIDDYTQFFGPAAVVGLKLAGVEGRSDWPRLLASAGMGYGIMALFVNTIKHTAKEMRPDGTSANSWPSGHTATAFVGATLLHKEYGLTRSPWYSVAGYGVATATGVMRVLNNRHWISDVLSGAGLGILSGELGYAICDLLFKGKGLLRNDIPGMANIIEHPSFFSISMGIGFGTRDLDFDMSEYAWSDDMDNMNLKFQASTAVAAEGAYFFNPYIGVGGRLRVKSTPIKGWNNIEEYMWNDAAWFFTDDNGELYPEALAAIDDIDYTIESDHLTEFAVDLGAYFNLPLSDRFALGSKLLIGRSIMQELSLDAKMSGSALISDGNDGWNVDTSRPFSNEWDYFTVQGNNTMKFGTGISLTYAYKQNFSWKVFLDYDYSRKTYTLTYDPTGFVKGLFPEVNIDEVKDLIPGPKSIKKNMHSFVLGASFAINF
ncbi:MAG: phosphatase PAP2 family protein [Prevotella sp.]|nr:phosphatase PAP2 family protein [Prevotella sp.]